MSSPVYLETIVLISLALEPLWNAELASDFQSTGGASLCKGLKGTVSLLLPETKINHILNSSLNKYLVLLPGSVSLVIIGSTLQMRGPEMQFLLFSSFSETSEKREHLFFLLPLVKNVQASHSSFSTHRLWQFSGDELSNLLATLFPINFVCFSKQGFSSSNNLVKC